MSSAGLWMLVVVAVLVVATGLPVWALLLGVAGMTGSAIHAGYDLANVIHPPASPLPADLPSIDKDNVDWDKIAR